MSAELVAEIVGTPKSRWRPYLKYKDSGVEWLEEVLRQGSKVIVIFQRGLTGCVLPFDPGRPVILSRIREPQIHSLPEELSACYAQGRAGNADERRFINLLSSFINFHPQLIDLKHIKKICWRMAF